MRTAERVLLWLTQEHLLIGASLARVSLGAWAVFYYLLHYPVRHFLWGPEGIWPFQQYLQTITFPGIWQVSASPLFFDIVYHMGLLIGLAYTLGFWSRLMGLLHWFMVWSLQERNVFIGDGGDNIMRIVLLFLVLVNTGAYFSIDAARRRSRPATTARQVLAIAHNFGLLLVLAQLSMVYLSTGLYKVMGEVWQNGTALYYILRVDEFSWPGVAEALYRNPYVVVAGTYGTVFFEVLFPPLLLNRWSRYAAISAGVIFHTGIALFMGLLTFSWSMLSVYPLLLSDREYLAAARRVWDRLGLVVFYDGWCPLCTRSIRWFGRLDLLSLVQFVSFRDPGVAERYGVDLARAERRIQGRGPGGRVSEGIDTLVQVTLRSVLLWPAGFVLVLCRLVIGQRAYDALAARRLVIIPGGCAEHCTPQWRPAG